MDFCLKGYLKSRVYAFNPQIAFDLNDAIRREIQQIPLDIVRASMISIIFRKQSVIAIEGGYVESL